MIATPVAMDIPLRTDERGSIRIGETRVLLELVVHLFQRGETAEGIVDSYPTLSLAEVYAVIAYYLANRDAVDDYLREREAITDRIQREVEANYSPEQRALHARLRALRDAKKQSDS